MSTFIVECDPATWVRAGLDRADEAESRSVCEQVFAAALDGHPLVSNRSIWRSFPWVWNGRWSWRNHVLIGDALHTAHYSIGSGTRLALEDALALAKALEAEPGDVPAGLARYEAARRPIVEKLVAASKMSAAWYDRFAEHMRLAPLELAMSYITRSGRIDDDRLRAMSPRFMALLRGPVGTRDAMSDASMRGWRAAACAGRAGDRLLRSRSLQRQRDPVRQLGCRARRPLCRYRVGGPAHLCRACGGCGAFRRRIAVAGVAAGGSRAAVPRRHAGLSGSPVWGDPRGSRAVADQHADAAGPAAVLSLRIRLQRLRSAMRPSSTASMRRPARERGSKP